MSRSSRSFTFHPTSRFDAFIEGQLSETAHQRVAKHLQDCPECANEVHQRATAYELTRQLTDTRSLHVTDGDYETEETKPVAGWKVVLSLGLLCAVVSGFVLTVWVIGGNTSPNPSLADGEALLPNSTQLAPVNANAEQAPQPGHHTGRPPTQANGSGEVLRSNTAPLGAQGRPLRLSMVPTMRTYGWNIPRDSSLGPQIEAAVVAQGTGWAEVSTILVEPHGAEPFRTVVRECRQIDDDGIGGCQGPSLSGHNTTELVVPGEDDVKLHQYPDDSWTAFMSTEHSQYRVDSNTAVAQATQVMAGLAVTERSRLSTGEIPETRLDRFERGLRNLLNQEGNSY